MRTPAKTQLSGTSEASSSSRTTFFECANSIAISGRVRPRPVSVRAASSFRAGSTALSPVQPVVLFQIADQPFVPIDQSGRARFRQADGQRLTRAVGQHGIGRPVGTFGK